MACVVRLSPLEAIQRRAWVTASTSIVKLEVETVHVALSSLMVVPPSLTVRPHPDWPLVTEPSVYTMRSCCLPAIYWKAWFQTLFCLLAILDSTNFPSFLAGIRHRNKCPNWFGYTALFQMVINTVLSFREFYRNKGSMALDTGTFKIQVYSKKSGEGKGGGGKKRRNKNKTTLYLKKKEREKEKRKKRKKKKKACKDNLYIYNQ